MLTLVGVTLRRRHPFAKLRDGGKAAQALFDAGLEVGKFEGFLLENGGGERIVGDGVVDFALEARVDWWVGVMERRVARMEVAVVSEPATLWKMVLVDLCGWESRLRLIEAERTRRSRSRSPLRWR